MYPDPECLELWFYLAGLQPSPPLPTWCSDPLLLVTNPLSDQEEMRDLDADHGQDGASPNSHKHFFPYMGFCASIWNNVRHHCHHHHHHHHIQKSKSINTEACLIAHWLKLRYGLMMQAILGHAGDFITVWKKEKSTRPHGNPLCFPKNIFCPMWCNWKRMAVLESA